MTLRNLAWHLHHPIRIGLIRDRNDYETARRLLTEQISEPSNIPFPQFPIQTSNIFASELIGAWDKKQLIGAIFITNGIQYGSDPTILETYGHNVQRLTDSITVIQGLAIQPQYRRHGIGAKLKNTATLLAHKRGTRVIIAIPTTNAARELNKKSGYILYPPGVFLMINTQETGECFAFGIDPASTWSVYPITQPGQATLSIGYTHTISTMDTTVNNTTWIN
ncbi:MAG: GNAT family N-acetyltransferase [Arcanobacterium sp.]|nr:GNAT family N-acetyltransferase [Arcanobacterium sp.]